METQQEKIDRLFGQGTYEQIQQSRRKALTPEDALNQLKSLRVRMAALGAQFKDFSSGDVDRVAVLLAQADRLLLQRDQVMKLIESQGFDAVESTLQTLAGEKSLKGAVMHPFWHTEVKSLDIAEIEQLVKSKSVTKETRSRDFWADLYK